MSWLARHPAPGFGDLLPGSFVVPQNPIEAPRYIPRIGEILPGRFNVPENPLIQHLRSGLKGLGGCGCGGDSTMDTAYINGTAVPGVGGVMDSLANIDWLTVAIAAGAAYMLVKK